MDKGGMQQAIAGTRARRRRSSHSANITKLRKQQQVMYGPSHRLECRRPHDTHYPLNVNTLRYDFLLDTNAFNNLYTILGQSNTTSAMYCMHSGLV